MKDTDGICNIDLEEVIEKLGGDGITLSQARRACKEGIFYFPNAVRAATALELPNWEKALGKAVAHVHPKAKDYYEDEEAYLHNQKALEEGRLEDVDRAAARAAANAAGAAEADWATWAAAATKAAWDAAEAAAATWTAWAAAVAVDDVNDLIDIYFDVLEEA
jgi:hypothetical protein